MNKKLRSVAIFAHHPIYYQTPIFTALKKKYSNLLSSHVLFGSDISLKATKFAELQTSFKPDYPFLLDGYDYSFFKNYQLRKKGFFSRFNPGVLFYLLKNRPSVLLIHGYETFSAWLFLFFAKLIGIKVVWRGEAVFRGHEHSDNQTFKNKFKKVVLTFFFRRCHHVMYSCRGNREYLEYHGVNPKKMSLIPCAVDNYFHDLKKSEYLGRESEIRESLGISEDQFVILFIARFVDRKKPLDLINAVSKMKNKENVTVLYVGNGPLMDEMEKAAKESDVNVVFTGFKNQTEIPLYFMIANLSAVISSHDPSPKTVNEAMGYGLPILATEVIGTSHDLVVEDKNGFIVQVGETDRMAECLDAVSTDKELEKRLGNESLNILKNWTVESDADAIYDAVMLLAK